MIKPLRRKTKIIKIGKVLIGGANPIAIQSMTKTKTALAEATVSQIKELEEAGCDIVRLAIKDNADAKALKNIKRQVKIPLVADIHFDWRLALEVIDYGVDKIRLNPGNIYKKEQIKEIAKAAKINHIPIRVGLNSGSLPCLGAKKDISERMVKFALDYIKTLESFSFYDIVVSLKASNICDTLTAYRRMAKLCGYPFHLGVTATGLPFEGAIKSSIAIGSLLQEGIGDTIRVSLTDNPIQEVKVAKYILAAVGLRNFGPEIISCPTCGRCEVDLIALVKEFEKKLKSISRQLTAIGSQPIRIALMGCVVNGPQEAKEADIGVAFGKKEGLLFKKGKSLKKVSLSNCAAVLLKELKNLN